MFKVVTHAGAVFGGSSTDCFRVYRRLSDRWDREGAVPALDVPRPAGTTWRTDLAEPMTYADGRYVGIAMS